MMMVPRERAFVGQVRKGVEEGGLIAGEALRKVPGRWIIVEGPEQSEGRFFRACA